MKNIVYALKDPRNDLAYYVGKSSVGKKRPIEHLSKSHSKLVNDWVNELSDNWLDVVISIIEEVDNLDDLPEREKYWIGYYFDKNPGLLNIQNKPDDLYSAETKEENEEFDFLSRVISRIPDIVKRERIKRNITQSDMADELSISRSTLSSLERGMGVTFKTVFDSVLYLRGFDIINNSMRFRSR